MVLVLNILVLSESLWMEVEGTQLEKRLWSHSPPSGLFGGFLPLCIILGDKKKWWLTQPQQHEAEESWICKCYPVTVVSSWFLWRLSLAPGAHEGTELHAQSLTRQVFCHCATHPACHGFTCKDKQLPSVWACTISSSQLGCGMTGSTGICKPG